MWDIDTKYLQKDEIIEYVDRPSMVSCIFSYIWVGLMALSLISLIAMWSIHQDEISFLTFPIVMYSFLALPGIYVIFSRLSTRFAISNRGLIKRSGIFTTNLKTVPFKHITSIEVKETIIGKMLRYAHLLIDTSGSGQAIELRWDYVGAAHKVKRLIEKNVVNEN